MIKKYARIQAYTALEDLLVARNTPQQINATQNPTFETLSKLMHP